MEKGEPPCNAGRNVSWYNYYGEQYGDSFKNMNKTVIWPRNPTTSHMPLRNHNWKIHRHISVHHGTILCASLVAPLVKNLPTMQETWVRFLGQEDSLEKEMVAHYSILAWRISWTEDPGGLVHKVARVRHDSVTKPNQPGYGNNLDVHQKMNG